MVWCGHLCPQAPSRSTISPRRCHQTRGKPPSGGCPATPADGRTLGCRCVRVAAGGGLSHVARTSAAGQSAFSRASMLATGLSAGGASRARRYRRRQAARSVCISGSLFRGPDITTLPCSAFETLGHEEPRSGISPGGVPRVQLWLHRSRRPPGRRASQRRGPPRCSRGSRRATPWPPVQPQEAG